MTFMTWLSRSDCLRPVTYYKECVDYDVFDLLVTGTQVVTDGLEEYIGCF
jgi:hypothetical protein